MRLLRWSRWALVLFVAACLVGMVVPALTGRQAIVEPAFWLCVVGIGGFAGASIAVLAAQLALALRRGKERTHG